MKGPKNFEDYLDEYSYDCYEQECAEEKYDEYLESLGEAEFEAELLNEVRMELKPYNRKKGEKNDSGG